MHGRKSAPGWYRFRTCSPTGRPVRGEYGIRMTVDGGLELLAKAGTVIIPGWPHIEATVPTPLVDALRLAHRRGARLLSICSGSVVLAATGLLDGKRMTTHWRFAAQVQQRFPRTQVVSARGIPESASRTAQTRSQTPLPLLSKGLV